jgi:hypothetical protein
LVTAPDRGTRERSRSGSRRDLALALALAGAAVLVGAVMAALVSPAPIEAVERSSSP